MFDEHFTFYLGFSSFTIFAILEDSNDFLKSYQQLKNFPHLNNLQRVFFFHSPSSFRPLFSLPNSTQS